MHSTIYGVFRGFVASRGIKGRILEVGAVPSPESLLAMDLLQGQERVGLNLDGNVRFDGFGIVAGNANDMSMFPADHFDCVLSNATLEHDPFFWKTCAEIRRVLRVGGTAIIGVPGFTAETGMRELGIPAWSTDEGSWANSALTFRFHGAPNDYYRFSTSALRAVVFAGYRDIDIRSVMVPPRLIGIGVKAPGGT
jgi:SAM-dependent methyltransferase